MEILLDIFKSLFTFILIVFAYKNYKEISRKNYIDEQPYIWLVNDKKLQVEFDSKRNIEQRNAIVFWLKNYGKIPTSIFLKDIQYNYKDDIEKWYSEVTPLHEIIIINPWLIFQWSTKNIVISLSPKMRNKDKEVWWEMTFNRIKYIFWIQNSTWEKHLEIVILFKQTEDMDFQVLSEKLY